jgi:3-isopropylmalate dehydrogenase
MHNPMLMAFKIAVLRGDGIGPEVVSAALDVLRVAAPGLEYEEALIGGAAYDAAGHPLPASTLDLCRRADAVLLGAVGGPKWDSVEPVELRPEVGALLPLRRELNLYANLRPAKVFPALREFSPIKECEIDLVVVRELTGGIYFGRPRERREGGEVAVDTCLYSRSEIRRIAVRGFEIARQRRKRLTSVDKANVLETSRMWREIVAEVAQGYSDVTLENMLVDNCAMQLVRESAQFDVILTENMFGDILSDEAAQITGSLGMLPSASLSDPKGGTVFGLYEPAHGSAPDIAGQGIANPLATILSAAMMLRYSLGMDSAAASIESAVASSLEHGVRTGDLGGSATTMEMASAVVDRLS